MGFPFHVFCDVLVPEKDELFLDLAIPFIVNISSFGVGVETCEMILVKLESRKKNTVTL